jgi:hypothetical protein
MTCAIYLKVHPAISMLMEVYPRPDSEGLVDLRSIELRAKKKHGEKFTKDTIEKYLARHPEILDTGGYAIKYNRPITVGYTSSYVNSKSKGFMNVDIMQKVKSMKP